MWDDLGTTRCQAIAGRFLATYVWPRLSCEATICSAVGRDSRYQILLKLGLSADLLLKTVELVSAEGIEPSTY
jgi:hypothetical protein